MPAVNWVERGRHGDGNSLPRYHIVWGTSRELTRRMIAALRAADSGGRLTVLHGHRVSALDHAGRPARRRHRHRRTQRRRAAPARAGGGAGHGRHQRQPRRRRAPTGRPIAPARQHAQRRHPFADGRLHHWAAGTLGRQITHAGEMWNYAAGFPHPFPHPSGARPLDHSPASRRCGSIHSGAAHRPRAAGDRLRHALAVPARSQAPGPGPGICSTGASPPRSSPSPGAEHNQRIRDMQFPMFLKETLLGNHRLVRQMQPRAGISWSTTRWPAWRKDERADRIARRRARRAAGHGRCLRRQLRAWRRLHNDDQIRRILHARQWGPDRLRAPASPRRCSKPGAGPSSPSRCS